MQQNVMALHPRVCFLHSRRSSRVDSQAWVPSSFDNSELIPRMPTQDIRRDSGTHSLYSWVCDYYRQSIRAWDIPDDFCREEWR